MKLFVSILMVSFFLIGCNTSKNEISKEVIQTKKMEESSHKSARVEISNSELVATVPSQIQIGIESIIESNGKVEINVYALNEYPIYGVQFDIKPSDIFKIDSIGGGRCGDADFTLDSNC